MGRAREVMDRITAAGTTGDLEALAGCYAEDAVFEAPDCGRLEGRQAILEYYRGFATSFSELRFEAVVAVESGDVAVDEGFLLGRNTGPLPTPDGELPATGRSVRVRMCDVMVLRGDAAGEHRMYYDQLDVLQQLGVGQQEIVLPDQQQASSSAPAR